MSELKDGRPKRYQLEGKRIAIVRCGDHVAAFVPDCPHARADLTHGRYEGETVACHWHGWKFDLRTGAGINNDAHLKLFAVTVENGRVWVDLRDEISQDTEDPDIMPEIRWKNESVD